MKYFKPKSLTWWSGAIAAAIPVAQYFGVPISPELASTIYKVVAGTGIIGLRGALGQS